MNIKIGQLRLPSLRNRNFKKCGKINRASETCDLLFTLHKHIHNKSPEGEGWQKKIFEKINDPRFPNLKKKIVNHKSAKAYT